MYTFPNTFALLGGLLLLPALANSYAINVTSTEHIPNLLGTQNGPDCPTNNTLMTPECPCLTADANTATTTTLTKRDNPQYMHDWEQYTSSSGWRVQVQDHSLYVAPHSWSFASYGNTELLMNSVKHEALYMPSAYGVRYCVPLAQSTDWRVVVSQYNGWRVRDMPDDLATRLLRSAMAGWTLYNSVEFDVYTAPGDKSVFMFTIKIGLQGHLVGC